MMVRWVPIEADSHPLPHVVRQRIAYLRAFHANDWRLLWVAETLERALLAR